MCRSCIRSQHSCSCFQLQWLSQKEVESHAAMSAVSPPIDLAQLAATSCSSYTLYLCTYIPLYVYLQHIIHVNISLFGTVFPTQSCPTIIVLLVWSLWFWTLRSSSDLELPKEWRYTTGRGNEKQDLIFKCCLFLLGVYLSVWADWRVEVWMEVLQKKKSEVSEAKFRPAASCQTDYLRNIKSY